MEHEIAVQPFLSRWQNRLAEVGFVIALVAYVVFSVVWGLAHRETFFSAEEQATYLFAKQFQESSSLALNAPSLKELPEAVHPSGMTRVGDYLLPVGIPAYPLALGVVAKVIGNWFMPLLAPLLALFGVLSWVHLLRPFVGRRIAMTAGVLTLAHPAFLMYTVRGYFADGIFLSLAMIAVGFFVRILMLPKQRMPRDGSVEMQIPWYLELGKKRHLLSTFFGLTFALSLVIRPSEGVWLGLIVAALFIMLRVRLRPFSFLFAAAGGLLVLIPALYLHWIYYGSGFGNGIGTMVVNGFLAPVNSDPHFLRAVFEYFFVRLFWWISLATVLGLVYLLRRGVISKLRLRLLTMAGLSLLTGVWVLWYYGGSMGLAGVGDVASVGSPLARHFLPVYVMMTPLVAAYFCSIRRRSTIDRILISLAAIFFIFLSQRSVFWQEGGLLPLAKGARVAAVSRQEIISATPGDAILLVSPQDQLFFPHREILIHTKDADEKAALKELRAQGASVWLVDASGEAVFPLAERAWWREHRFAPRAYTTSGTWTLYQLIPF